VVIGGIALVVLVMRMLLAQAVARDAEAHHLRSELDEVLGCQPGDLLRWEPEDSNDAIGQ
jgi:hypothetical protein